MVWLNNSQDSTGTTCDARAGIARALHGNLQCFSYPTGPVRDPQGCRTAPLRTRKGIHAAIIGKNPTRALYLAVRGPYGPLTVLARGVHGLFAISKPMVGLLTCICVTRPQWVKACNRDTNVLQPTWWYYIHYLSPTQRRVHGLRQWNPGFAWIPTDPNTYSKSYDT